MMIGAVTAKSKDQLRKLGLAALKEYAAAYHIPVNNVVEKDDLVDRLISARVSFVLLHSSKNDAHLGGRIGDA